MNLLRAEMFLRDYGAGNTKLAELYDEDEMLRVAAESVIHRLGEAANRISDEVVAANPQAQWRGMKGMRNVVAHEYGAIDYNIVWNSLANDLPAEAAEVQRILDT